MKDRSGPGRPQPSAGRGTGKRLLILALAPVGAAVVAASSASADPVESVRSDSAGKTSSSYQLGYHKTSNDLEILASRMRAEGFTLEDVDISSRIAAVCASEARSVEESPEFDGSDFMRGCADGIDSLVQAGIVS